MEGAIRVVTKEPADLGHKPHTDTQGCTAEARMVQEAGTVPAPVSTVSASPQGSLSFQ